MRRMVIMGRIITSAVVVLFALICLAHARPEYQDRIPNGKNVVGSNGEPWPGVGHNRPGGGGTRNAFGQDFAAEGFKWTVELCRKDSDCDGLSNGVELGDPNCTWKEGEIPTFDRGITHPGQTDAERQATIDSCKHFPTRQVSPQESNVTLTFANYAVPTKETTYVQQGFIVDKAALGGADNLHAIRFSPIVEHANVVHHMLLYACESASDIQDYMDEPKEGPMKCSELVWAWAVGAGDFCLPLESGLPLAGFAFDAAKPWYLLETHYDNPQNTPGIKDNSGVKITLVPKTGQMQDAAYMLAGLVPSSAGVPANKPRFEWAAECAFPEIPAPGITAFAYAVHAHKLGRKLWVEVSRETSASCTAEKKAECDAILGGNCHLCYSAAGCCGSKSDGICDSDGLLSCITVKKLKFIFARKHF